MPGGRLCRLSLLILAIFSPALAGPLEVVWPPDGPARATLSWPARSITAVGRARRGPRTPLAFAERAARVDALGNIAQVARLAGIDAVRQVGTLVDADPEFRESFQAFLRLTSFGPPQEDAPGWITVAAAVPLFGVVAGQPAQTLGPLLYDRPDVWDPEVEPTADPAPRGVVLDCRDLEPAGAFAPRVEDEAGRVVWTVECADRPLADAAGAVEYHLGPDDLADSRAGDDPLQIRPVRVTGPVIVVSVADGLRLAPPRQATAWRPVGWWGIRTLTPVSPFQRVVIVGGPTEPGPAAPPGG